MIKVTSGHKPILTPRGLEIAVPTQALADQIVLEAKEKYKPLTHLASVAIDLVMKQRAQVMEDILVYSDTDVVCYRADNDAPLLGREEALLAPLVEWANVRFRFTLMITHGVMPVRQPDEVPLKLAHVFDTYNEWQLAALAFATKLLGSILLATALVEGYIAAEHAFACAFIEEEFETEKWGKDDEKEARHEQLKREITAVAKFIKLLQNDICQ